ncbi:MAG: UDP-4-amino-4-deoxy-L-arabinose--oxoglutarate aminotransferase [Candidatus Argoarchaeum ethanivorans]|uniref:UDP-4-amino-4-deoxy-L-arabinose--oxoglutarate aminotransferase n=1 Tax=Candidatus Argoarchaeum ethanivorans TaxID=2608793 RepID=A0A811T4E5_9EURY|nr:MAG: UDP-4-amino-4-deoxy-L-arabinose--oxoglutarate aminotransferase [Candidatus Argoarchaeum ethanivorans]
MNWNIAVGDIFVYLVPFTDKVMEKPRPVLVVSGPNSKGDIMVLVGSSKIRQWNEPWQMVIQQDDLREGRLDDATVFPCSKQLVVSPKLFSTKIGSLRPEKIEKTLRMIAAHQTETFYKTVHKPVQHKEFIQGKNHIPYAGRVYDEKEMISLVDSALDFWLTAGRFAKQFEAEFARFLGVKHCIIANSGSSANLLAISALTSPKLGERRLKPDDEVITVAAAFPTTINPIIQNNLVPVFLDVDIGTYNIQVDKIEDALSEKTKAIFLAHTLGNSFDLDKILEICEEYNLWLIEDNCDALGSKYNGKYTGTFGDIATFSFYPPHHITMGEGGALVTNDAQLKRLIESFRDWGRDCWCEPGHDNTCGKRFGWQLGTLPFGYDHKYIYSHIGYNLKVTDMQAAVGVEQLKKLPDFIRARKRNWRLLYEGLKKYEDYFILPKAADNSDPSWFGFLLTVKENAPFSRNEIANYLEENNIATRLLFSGNIIQHPGFENVRYRVYNNLGNTDFIMNNTFWIGVYPGLTDEMIDYILKKFDEFLGGGHK